MKVIGYSDEVLTCECCGKSNLKMTVVLSSRDAGGEMFYGRDCAAKAVYGSKKHADVKTVESIARGIAYAKKWIGMRSALVVANAVRVRFCACSTVGEALHFSNGVIVEAE